MNGQPVEDVRPGSYAVLNRRWQPGDRVSLTLDFSLRAWIGERETTGNVSVYRGPILLAYDQRHNPFDPADLPELEPSLLRAARAIPWGDTPGDPTTPLLRVTIPTSGGDLVLCDFASAGVAGNPYRSWLPFNGIEPAPFSRDNPLRTVQL